MSIHIVQQLHQMVKWAEIVLNTKVMNCGNTYKAILTLGSWKNVEDVIYQCLFIEIAWSLLYKKRVHISYWGSFHLSQAKPTPGSDINAIKHGNTRLSIDHLTNIIYFFFYFFSFFLSLALARKPIYVWNAITTEDYKN